MISPLNDATAWRIKKFMHNNGVTTAQLAFMIGMPQGKLSDKLTCKTGLDVGDLDLISCALRVDPIYLLTGVDPQ